MPWLAVRLARLAAAARPFLRRPSRAAVMSPLASTSADLQSIIPAPVSSRSLRTISAEISIPLSLFDFVDVVGGPRRRRRRGYGRYAVGDDQATGAGTATGRVLGR